MGRWLRQSKEHAELLLNFKFRTCTLLDIYLKKCPASPHVPGMLLPLLRSLSAALAPAPDGNEQLAKRIGHLITHGYARAR